MGDDVRADYWALRITDVALCALWLIVARYVFFGVAIVAFGVYFRALRIYGATIRDNYWALRISALDTSGVAPGAGRCALLLEQIGISQARCKGQAPYASFFKRARRCVRIDSRWVDVGPGLGGLPRDTPRVGNYHS